MSHAWLWLERNSFFPAVQRDGPSSLHDVRGCSSEIRWSQQMAGWKLSAYIWTLINTRKRWIMGKGESFEDLFGYTTGGFRSRIQIWVQLQAISPKCYPEKVWIGWLRNRVAVRASTRSLPRLQKLMLSAYMQAKNPKPSPFGGSVKTADNMAIFSAAVISQV